MKRSLMMQIRKMTIVMALGSTFVLGSCAVDLPESDHMTEPALRQAEDLPWYEASRATDEDVETLVSCLPRAYLDGLVERLYEDILDSQSDAAGKNFWLDEIERLCGLGIAPRGSYGVVIKLFFGSAQYAALDAAHDPARRNSLFIEDLYQAFFDRPLDSEGNSYWLSQMRQGLNREAVLVSFMESAEFDQKLTSWFGPSSQRRELSLLVDVHRAVFAHMPYSTVFEFDLHRVRSAQCSGHVAVANEVRSLVNYHFNGAEYASRGRTDAQYVADLYEAFFDRPVDTGGFSYWVIQVPVLGRQGVRDQLFASPEWAARVSQIAAEPCIPGPW